MPIVRPFRAVRYNTDKLKDLSTVVAPPYDVISKGLQDELYRVSPNNVVRLILNKITPRDTKANNRYTRAKKFFDLWIKERVLVRDKKDSFYIYSQKYKDGNVDIEQTGFLGLMALETLADEKVLPHENTLAAPKADRLELTRAVKANLEPIFVLYDDGKVTKLLKKYCAKFNAIIDVRREGVRHRVWRADDPKIMKAIEAHMEGKDIFIADGHHRYEVAKMYAKESRDSASKYIMVYFVESDEKMLTVLPAHRLIKEMNELRKDDIITRLSEFFSLEKVPGKSRMMDRLKRLSDKHVFGMYLGKGNFYILRLKSVKASDSAIEGKSESWKHLDVSILHLFVFQHVLGITDDDDNVDFLKDPLEAIKAVDSGRFKAAFFLNPTKVSEVKKIAKLGERMPRKSTYFYPKQLSGLLINKF